MVRRWLARYVTPLAWKWAPLRRAQAMREYSLIEKDSGCQILDALELVHEPAVRAQLFQQVLEEFHHSDLFEDVCRELSDKPIGTPVVTRDALVGRDPGPDALLDLIAYVHVGEAAVNVDFAAYAKAPIDPVIAKAFARAGRRASPRRRLAPHARALGGRGRRPPALGLGQGGPAARLALVRQDDEPARRVAADAAVVRAVRPGRLAARRVPPAP
ncbi:MAG: hypothetical protein HY077_07825 [Elusimicrobia bacterium]|nr:hypothetical protein [Elusimicrobiota bacterium]